MARTRTIFVRFALVAAFVPGIAVAAQTPQRPRATTEQVPGKPRVTQNQDLPPMPPADRNLKIDLLPLDRMSDADRRLEASSEAAIFRRAELWGMNRNQGKWTVEQVACPALPNHLLLRYTRNGGPGDVSIFTASMLRQGGQGQLGSVRITPLVRRGYSLNTPAQMNPLTLAAFNRVRGEEKPVKDQDWLAVGLCYAAFAGSMAHVDKPEAEAPEPNSDFPAWVPAVTITEARDATVEFTDSAAKPQPMEWTLNFDAQGRLVNAAHEPNPALTLKKIVGEPAEPQGTAIHSTVDDDAPWITPIRVSDSSEPDGKVIHSPNDNSVPLPQGVEPDQKIPPPSKQ